MTKRRRFADGTTTSVESSRGEISGILGKHGVVRMAWASEPSGDVVQFELEGAQYRLSIARPTADELKKRDSAEYVYPSNVDWSSKIEPEWRRRWRATVLLLKAKLEFAEGDGPSTIQRELMPYMLVDGNMTLEEAIVGGKIPRLAARSS